MNLDNLLVTKENGEKQLFSLDKFRSSLSKARAGESEITAIVNQLRDKLYPGIPTREIYRLASRLLRKQAPSHAARFSLKKAILELGPSGYPFEKFISALFQEDGFTTKVGSVLPGKCVQHEIDVFGTRNEELVLLECKFHNQQGIRVDVKVPLYIHSRFQDLLDNGVLKTPQTRFTGWIATNSSFSDDAIAFARCKGIQLLGWKHPSGNSLKDRIDRTGLFPVTCLSTLTRAEKDYLLENGWVLVRDLLQGPDGLSEAGISGPRIKGVEAEMRHLMDNSGLENEGHFPPAGFFA